MVYQASPITTPTTNQNPSYGFVSTEAGTIRYGGDCSSQTTAAAAGLNTVVFNTLPNGAHTNCTITVTDASGNVSNQLVVSPFTIAAATAVTTPATSTNLTTEMQSLESQLSQLQSQTSGSAASNYNFTEFLSLGSQDAQVTALQQRLTADGFYSGPITGYFGTLTESAVEKFQSAHAIAVKGYVGPSTRSALNAGE
jgi:murein L,D-transpeptidase YcbB/YkuD